MADLTHAYAASLITDLLAGEVWIGLFANSAGKAGSLAGEVPVGTYTEYARQRLDTIAAADGIGNAVINATVTFPLMTGPLLATPHYALLTASTAGSVIMFDAFPEPLFVGSGAAQIVLAAGSISIGFA